ncbi:uncharacterized protein M6D78_018608 isoform 1-T1 [Vipera latastei]
MKNKGEAQNNEKFALISSCPVNTDRPPYTGKYTLFDLQDYATKNQDQLIMHLEKILKPDNFETLKKELMCSVLNTFFSFTAQKYYELFRNGELKEFLQNVSSGKKSEKIPKKLLIFMFSKKKNNRKRKAQEQMQRQGNINLKKRQLVNIDDDDDDDKNDDNELDKVTRGTDNEKIIQIHPIEHKPEKNQLVNIDDNDDKNDDNELDKVTRGTDNEKIIQIHPIEHKPGNEDSNVTEEHWLDQDSKFKIQAIKNWYGKNNYNREEISLNYISIHKHKAYSCFTAQDVLQFKLPDDPDYSILAILEDKKDFTRSGNLKKDVEFALQFNMAVLNVKFCEVTSSNGFFNRIQANGSFAESEFFLKCIVFEIVLPVLALYKWVNLDAFKNAVYLNT